jgi:energy-coupling factor transport system substrate-specific component
VLALLVVASLAAAGVLGPWPRGASAASPLSARADQTPTGYLLAAENGDGGLGSAPGHPSSPLYSGWAALGLAAEGHNPADVSRGGHSLLGYIQATVATDPGSLERTILVARAAGASASDFGGHDLVAALQRDIRRDGSVADQVNLTTFAVLALRAAGLAPPARMLPWLVAQQDADGGFSFATAGDQADIDDTGAALEALAGTAPAASRRAITYIRAGQNPDGGFPSQPGGDSDAQSAAWAVQGLIAAGVAPASLHDRSSRSPLQYLGSLITPSGAIDYARATSQTPVWVTGEALMALAGKPLPLAPAPRAAATNAHAVEHRLGRHPSRPHAHRVDRRARRDAHPRRRVPATPTPGPTPVATVAGAVLALLLAPVGAE